MVEKDAAPASAAKKNGRFAGLGAAGILIGVALVFAVRHLPSDASKPTAAATGNGVPQAPLAACVYGAASVLPLGNLSLAEFQQAVSRPDAKLTWEKSPTGYILRQTISDQLAKDTKENAFSFQTVDPARIPASLRPDAKAGCGPGAVLLDRAVLNGQELTSDEAYQVALQVVGPVIVAKQAKSAPTSRPTEAAPVQSAGALKFTGQGEGELDLTLSATGPGRYHFAIGTGAPGCGGGAEGDATESSGVITGIASDDPQCKISMTRTATGLKIEEDGCGQLHGAACSFEGDVKGTTAQPAQ